ncbi:MAG: glucuronate isomerase [Victivallaceae bacterium]|nr:glucuronate isomerase [Victivallaceae bacterium]
MPFDSDYLLTSDPAREIFDAVRDLKIIDSHSHADPAAIAEDRPPRDLWELTAATDHYVWELERKCGVDEEFITGSRPPFEKFREFARVFPLMAGNPVYDWTCLDLRRRLGFDGELRADNAEAVWNAAAGCDLRPSKLLENVEVLCTTDDPADDLAFHTPGGRVLPTWRPDRYLNIAAPGWLKCVERLGRKFNLAIDSLPKLEEALRLSHRFFGERGSAVSDYGLTRPLAGEPAPEAAAVIMKTALASDTVSTAEAEVFASHLFNFCCELDAADGRVAQLHIGAERNVRTSLFDRIGPDAGGDTMNLAISLFPALPRFLDRFDSRLKVVIYCLDPAHQLTVAGLCRAFGANVRTGAAWWLCDSPSGIRRQLQVAADVDLLCMHPGMVSDSRKLMSFDSRFELFRRTLADFLGELVIRGRLSVTSARMAARRVSYDNPKEFFFPRRS